MTMDGLPESVDVDALSRRLRALSNPHRLRIYLMVKQSRARNASGENGVMLAEVSSQLELAPSTVSHHVHTLVHAGLIGLKKAGKSIRLTMIDAGDKKLEQLFNSQQHQL